MKKLLILISILFLLLGCVTINEDHDSRSSKESEIPIVTLSLMSADEHLYSLEFESLPSDLDYNGYVKLDFFENGELKSGAGINFEKGRMTYELNTRYDLREKSGLSIYIYFDETGDSKPSKDEWGIEVGINDYTVLEKGLKLSLEKIVESYVHKEFSFIYPEYEYDLSMNPEPPIGFEKRDGDNGIGIIDFNFNKPIWIYKDTTLEQLHTLMPDAERDDRVFHLSDGGFVVINFDKEGTLSQFYPRFTNRFTLVGFPKLPWSRDIIAEIFGEDMISSLTEEKSVQFMGVSGVSGMNGFRLDSKDNTGTGFRIWHPDFVPSGQ